MTWGQEILRAVLLAFGAIEIITNINYLTKKNGLTLARIQHRELPKGIPDKNMKLKVICMLLSGIVLFTVSLSTYILHKYISNAIIIATVLFSVYAIIEAVSYRHWKTYGFSFVALLLMIASVLVR